MNRWRSRQVTASPEELDAEVDLEISAVPARTLIFLHLALPLSIFNRPHTVQLQESKRVVVVQGLAGTLMQTLKILWGVWHLWHRVRGLAVMLRWVAGGVGEGVVWAEAGVPI